MRAILAYHSVDDSGSVISIAPDAFRRHVRALVERRVRITTLDALLALPADADAVALTFDDGFANFATDAWPVLAEHGVPATVFVVSDRVGADSAWNKGPGPDVPVLPLLDWDQLARLQEAGVEIGSHTRTHADLRVLPAPALDDEIGGSAQVIGARTGRRPASFAYPFGRYRTEAETAVRAGYRLACTTQFGPVRAAPDAHRLPRLDAYYFRRATGLDAWGTPAFRRYLGWRAAGRRLGQFVRHTLPATA